MRTASWWLASSLALVALGCAGGQTPLAPTNPTPAGTGLSAPLPGDSLGTLGGLAVTGDLSESALAIYRLDIDLNTLSATSHLLETRSGQKNSDLYALSISNFMRPTSFRVTSVTADAVNLNVSYVVTHPFAGPTNLTLPPSASNRADLGIAGQVVFLADVASAANNTFFDTSASDRVVANTTLITNPDAYTKPAGLLATTGLANTFPYRQLVDETGATGTRVGITNGGTPTGNFGADGWTATELGTAPNYNKWTGYGVLHQGQSASNVVSISRADIAAAGTFSLNTAIIAKYNDPRAGANAAEKKANRLPSTSGDALTKMAYRMPHGALDVARIKFDSATGGGFQANVISAATLNFHLDDFDARATPSTQTDLSLETDVTKVGIGENGLPDFAVSIPGVLGDATVISDWDPTTDVQPDDSGFLPGGDIAIDSGAPGDPLYYTKSVNKTVTSGQIAGNYTGLARATDPEELIPTTGAPEIPLDGSTLLPLSANKPHNISFQAFPVVLSAGAGNTPPTATVTPPAANVASGNGVLSFQVTMNDVDIPAQTKSIQFNWNNDADYLDAGEGLVAVTVANQVFNSPIFYNNATLIVAARTTPFQYTDGVIASPIVGTPAGWNLGANQAPSVTGTPGLVSATLPSPANFTLAPGSAAATDPEGDSPISYSVTNNRNANAPTGAALNFVANATAITNPSNATVDFTIRANDALHPGVAGTAYPVVTGNITAGGCTPPGTQFFQADFETVGGNNAWVAGDLFSPALPNSDDASYSHFKGAGEGFCTANGIQSSLTGKMVNSGGDVGGPADCQASGGDYIDDYFTNLDNNIVSPTFSLAGKTSATITFNSWKFADAVDAAIHYRIYISTDNGATWGSAIYDTSQVTGGVGQGESNVAVTVPAGALGQANCRLRFQFLDSRGSFAFYVYTPDGTSVGWSFDNVRIAACP